MIRGLDDFREKALEEICKRFFAFRTRFWVLREGSLET